MDGYSNIIIDKVNKLDTTIYYTNLKKKLGLKSHLQWPTTGTVAIEWAIRNLLREYKIYVTGFSFYSECETEILNHYSGAKSIRDNHHDFYREKEYFEYLLEKKIIQKLSKESFESNTSQARILSPQLVIKKVYKKISKYLS